MATLISLILVTTISLALTTGSLCSSDAISAVLSSTGHTLFAHALQVHNLTATSTHRLTYLAPPDIALINHPILDSATFHRHVVATPARLSHLSVFYLPSNTTLPTLHREGGVRVVTEGERVWFNDVLVVMPNLYTDESCVVHGVDGLIPLRFIDDVVEETRNENVHTRKLLGSRMFSYIRYVKGTNRNVKVDDNAESRLP